MKNPNNGDNCPYIVSHFLSQSAPEIAKYTFECCYMNSLILENSFKLYLAISQNSDVFTQDMITRFFNELDKDNLEADLRQKISDMYDKYIVYEKKELRKKNFLIRFVYKVKSVKPIKGIVSFLSFGLDNTTKEGLIFVRLHIFYKVKQILENKKCEITKRTCAFGKCIFAGLCNCANTAENRDLEEIKKDVNSWMREPTFLSEVGHYDRIKIQSLK